MAKVLKKWRNKGEKYRENEKNARMGYLVEKTFSNEPLDKEDYEFIITLPKKDLESFVKSIRKLLNEYKDTILWVSEVQECEPFFDDIDGFVAWNKLLEFIASKREDIKAEKITINTPHTSISI